MRDLRARLASGRRSPVRVVAPVAEPRERPFELLFVLEAADTFPDRAARRAKLLELARGPPRTGNSCNDGNACTQADSCQVGTCTGGTPVVCSASDQCHDAGTCNAATGVCSNPAKADGTAWSNGVCQAAPSRLGGPASWSPPTLASKVRGRCFRGARRDCRPPQGLHPRDHRRRSGRRPRPHSSHPSAHQDRP